MRFALVPATFNCGLLVIPLIESTTVFVPPASQTGFAGPACVQTPPEQTDLWKLPLSSSVTMSPSWSTRNTPSVLPSPFLSTPATNSLNRSKRKRWPSQTGSPPALGRNRGT